MKKNIRAAKPVAVVLQDAELLRRRAENRKYLMELDTDKLLLHHRFEAGIDTVCNGSDDLHGGWEEPLCQLRGHFLGHWLSAAAIEVATTGDIELKAKADKIVSELAKCQEENGGEWCASVPEKYLHRIARGKTVWAPQYTIHKTFMGLLDQYELADNRQALEIAINFAKWFQRWSGNFNQEAFARILDVETGGMLEIWSQLYGITREPAHKELMDRYYRHSLFDGLLEGRDVLTNMHANTTIPEALGAAKAYTVTGDGKWFRIVQAYWKQAVTERGTFCTGGQTDGEVWTPKFHLSARLGNKNQEHCTVYNMMRLADFLFRHTGKAEYADYWERNLYNGIMAQGYYLDTNTTHGAKSPYPKEGLLAYFLPLKSGARKPWSSKTKDFFCCHGSLVQANAGHTSGIYYTEEDTVYVNQYIPSDFRTSFGSDTVGFRQRTDTLTGNHHMTGSMTGSQTINSSASAYPDHPDLLCNEIEIQSSREVAFTLKIRIPAWHTGSINVYVNREPVAVTPDNQYLHISRKWKNGDILRYEFRKEVYCVSLPDCPNMVAFLYGPAVLAGLSEGALLKTTAGKTPAQLLVHDNEREWALWKDTFRILGQSKPIRFIPLYLVGYEPYTVYFEVDEKG